MSLFRRLGPVIAGMPVEDDELKRQIQEPDSLANQLLKGIRRSALKTLEGIGSDTFSKEEQDYMEKMAPFRSPDGAPWQMPPVGKDFDPEDSREDPTD